MTDNIETPPVERTEEGFLEAYKTAQSRVNVVRPPSLIEEQPASPPPPEPTPSDVPPNEEEPIKEGAPEEAETKEVIPKPGHPTADLKWLEEIPEDHKDKIKQLLNEHKAAIGRAAFLQSKAAKQGGYTHEEKLEARFKPFVPPTKPEDWNALAESDPKFAEAIEARIKAELEAKDNYWKDQISDLLNPVLEAESQRQAQYSMWKEQQVQQVYEAVPNWTDIVMSDDYLKWLKGMDEQFPGFADYAGSVEYAYGDTNQLGTLGAVDIINLFMYQKYQAANPTPPKPTVVAEVPSQPNIADRVAQARNERLNQPPIPQGNPAVAVAQRKGQLDAQSAFEQAYLRARERLGVRKPM